MAPELQAKVWGQPWWRKPNERLGHSRRYCFSRSRRHCKGTGRSAWRPSITPSSFTETHSPRPAPGDLRLWACGLGDFSSDLCRTDWVANVLGVSVVDNGQCARIAPSCRAGTPRPGDDSVRQLKLEMQVSLDGLALDVAGKTDWMVWNWTEDRTWDEAPRRQHIDLKTSPECILLSRVMAEEDFSIAEPRSTPLHHAISRRPSVSKPACRPAPVQPPRSRPWSPSSPPG